MKTTELAVIGAGPAGMAACCEAARHGVRTMLLDEYVRPGGQLIKQIHKFFGSRSHRAGTRGIDIAGQYREELEKRGVELRMSTAVWGIFNTHVMGISHDGRTEQIRAEKLIIATGASENAVAFPGWTLPGVMTAGAAQTCLNVHRVLPGKKVLMIGAGNVGCIIAYQLLQAGAEQVTIVEAKPQIGAYSVHAAKIARQGVPILTSHTIHEVQGSEHVEGATIVALDEHARPVDGSKRELDVDLVCIACGLSPLTELARLVGCRFAWQPSLGGFVPLVSRSLETTVPDVYVAGDCGGVEEASTAIDEGVIAGVSAAESLGYAFAGTAAEVRQEAYGRLGELRCGPFGSARSHAKESLWQEWKSNEGL